MKTRTILIEDVTMGRPRDAPCSALRYADQMQAWFFSIVVLFLVAVLLWAWRRTRLSAPGDPPPPGPGEKPKFETTMGDLRDLRQALRPVQKERAHRPGD